MEEDNVKNVEMGGFRPQMDINKVSGLIEYKLLILFHAKVWCRIFESFNSCHLESISVKHIVRSSVPSVRPSKSPSAAVVGCSPPQELERCSP